MHYLFCKVMAIPESERTVEMKAKFEEVPYLNSSLFELTEIEKSTSLLAVYAMEKLPS